MAFKNIFGRPQQKEDKQQATVAAEPVEAPKVAASEVVGMLRADANSMSESEAKYASLLAEYQKNDPNRLKQFPTYLTYTLSRNRELLGQQMDALKARESCIEHSMRIYSKYQKGLAHIKIPQDLPSQQKLIRMKDEIGQARLMVKEELAKLEAIATELQASDTMEEPDTKEGSQ